MGAGQQILLWETDTPLFLYHHFALQTQSKQLAPPLATWIPSPITLFKDSGFTLGRPLSCLTKVTS